ncbi:ribbon-helix-helix protein, CopG family [Micromonospora sp. HK10]|uniref:ribbon-helix-helix protein, CopG family n=1 Tax=Micromonospora sp. HK10 TaxID=1538294 RepID=UPI0006272806|nr:ribbon-helix-helix protein, CopG family [Micromonospora sp. HK10]KKK07771.1 histidine kinase [Micromonospora sp. HK10]
MELRTYVDAIRQQLAVAAAAGGDDARDLAERLTAPLESAVRLALLDALSEAATEITRDLAPGSVDLRLRDREPSFVVTPPPTEQWTDETEAAPPSPAPPPPADGEDEATVRISLRLPENLKARVEHAAARAGVSINTWLIRAATAAVDTDNQPHRPDTPRRSGPATGGQRFTGWVR